MSRKGIRVWVSRAPHASDVELHRRKPQKSKEYSDEWWWEHPSWPLGEFCYIEWKRVTGYTLKRGECKRVRIVVEEV